MLDVEPAFINNELGKNLRRKKTDFSPISDLAAGSAAMDVNSNLNANSPGHCSSQDGSFIQDDDMRLILEFGGLLVADKPTIFTASVTSSTSRRRRRARFDADVIAQLDFEDFSASRDMAPLYDVNRKRAADDSVFGSDGGDLFAGSVVAADYGCPSPCQELSPSAINLSVKSLRSFPIEPPPPSAAFISTDSLDSSSLSMTEENFLQNFCAPNKRQYVLTFDKQAFESGLAVFSTILDSYSSFSGENFNFCDKNSKFGAENLDFITHENSNFTREQNLHNIGGKMSNFSSQLANYAGQTMKSERGSLVEDKNCNKCDTSKACFVESIFCNGNQILDENLNQPAFNDKDTTRLRNCSENLHQTEAIQNGENHADKFAYFSEQNLKENNEEEDNTVTWQRIKRSYDQAPNFPPTSKCISLPNLKPSPSLFSKFENLHENDTSEQDKISIPDWNLVGRGDCLLKVFKQQQMKQNPFLLCDRKLSNQSESGYHTGTGSSNIGNFPVNNQLNFDLNNGVNNPFEAYTTADQCKLLTKINSKNPADPDNDFEYGDYYVNGRYVDLNHNETGFSDKNTMIRRKSYDVPHPGPLVYDGSDVMDTDSDTVAKPPPAKPPRTFRTFLTDQENVDEITDGSTTVFANEKSRHLLDRSAQTTDDVIGSVSIEVPSNSVTDQSPDLEFLRFPFKIPPLNVALTPFLRNFLGDADSASLTSLLSDKNPQLVADRSLTVADPPKLTNNRNKTVEDQCPFSNVSPTTNNKGFVHVQDWDSLATLLPDNVVKCCRFFAEQNFGGHGFSNPPSKFDFSRNIDKPSRPKSTNMRRRSFGSGLHCPYYSNRFDKIDEVDDILLDDDGSPTVFDPLNRVDNRQQRMAASDTFCTQKRRCCGAEPCGDYCNVKRVPLPAHTEQRCRCGFSSSSRIPKFSFDNKNPDQQAIRRFAVVQVSDLIERQIFDSKVESLMSLVQKITAYCGKIDSVFNQSVLKNADSHFRSFEIELGAILFNSLCPCIEGLILDGLSPEKSFRDLINSSNIADIATKSICGLLISGHGVLGNTRERSLQFAIFVDSLLSCKSLDVWISNLIFDERLLFTHYSKFAYLRLLATKTCVNLYECMFKSLKLLSRLPFDCLQLIDVDMEAESREKLIHGSKASTTPPALKMGAESRRKLTSGNTASTTPTDQSPPSSPKKSLLKTPRVYCSRSVPPTAYHNRPGTVEDGNLIVVQNELRIVFRFPATVTNNQMISNGRIKNEDVLSQLLTNSPARPSCSPARLADDSRIPKNSSSILLRLNSPCELKPMVGPSDDVTTTVRSSGDKKPTVRPSRDATTTKRSFHDSGHGASGPAAADFALLRDDRSPERATICGRESPVPPPVRFGAATPKSRIPLPSRMAPRCGSKMVPVP